MTQRIRLYFDEDAQRTDLIQSLRARQIDILSVSEANLLGKPDDVQLSFATTESRAIFSFNRGDFYQLHTQWLMQGRHHAGIIISDQLSTGIIIRRLLKLIDAKSAEDMSDWLEFLSNWR